MFQDDDDAPEYEGESQYAPDVMETIIVPTPTTYKNPRQTSSPPSSIQAITIIKLLFKLAITRAHYTNGYLNFWLKIYYYNKHTFVN